MKQTLLLISLISLIACNSQGTKQDTSSVQDSIGGTMNASTPPVSGVSYNQVQGYALKPDSMTEVIRHLVIARKSQYDSLFLPARTNGNKINPPDFSGNRVIAILYPSSGKSMKPAISGIDRIGNTLRVHYDLQDNTTKTDDKSPFALISVSRFPDVDSVYFFRGNEPVDSVEIVP